VQVDAVQQRAGKSREVTRHLFGAAATTRGGIAGPHVPAT